MPPNLMKWWPGALGVRRAGCQESFSKVYRAAALYESQGYVGLLDKHHLSGRKSAVSP